MIRGTTLQELWLAVLWRIWAKAGARSTVAHDSHNAVVGMDGGDMVLAANTLAEVGGGMVVAETVKF